MQVHRVVEATAVAGEVLVGHHVAEDTSAICNGLLQARAIVDCHKAPQVHRSRRSRDQVRRMINPINRVGSERLASMETTNRRLGPRQINHQRGSRRGQYLIMIVIRRCLLLLLPGHLLQRRPPRRLLQLRWRRRLLRRLPSRKEASSALPSRASQHHHQSPSRCLTLRNACKRVNHRQKQ